MPEEAIEFEKLKSNVLGIFKKYNYEYVIPPIIDNLTNLLSLNSSDVDQLTVTFTDQISGKQIGLRSDITSQIAMIDYQQSKSGLSRFGYMGDIVRISKSLFDRKNPFQVGAELFGRRETTARLSNQTFGGRDGAVDQCLRGLPGVQDVVILKDEATAYLKVDRQHFDEQSLAGLAFVRQGSNS